MAQGKKKNKKQIDCRLIKRALITELQERNAFWSYAPNIINTENIIEDQSFHNDLNPQTVFLLMI